MLLAILMLLLQVAVEGRDPNTPATDGQPGGQNRLLELQKKAFKLVEAARKLGNWNEHAALSRAAIEKVFERSGWDAPEDLFAFEIFRAVDSHPPWAFNERADTFFSLLSKRYNLNEDQRARLEELVVREATGLFAQHADTILAYSTEMIEARASGQPFTADQVGRWAKLSEPVMIDGHRRLIEASEEFMEDLSPEQREIVQADLRAGNRRFGGVQEMMREWKEGRWEPSDWGMEEDPIQTGNVAAEREALAMEKPADTEAARPSPPVDGIAATPTRPEKPADRPEESTPEEPNPAENASTPESRRAQPKPPARAAIETDPWAKYVQAFIDKHKLEAAQRQKAWVFYEQAKERVVQVNERWGPARDKAAEKKSDATRLTSELERAFSQLKLRLERLPTRVQRRDATPGEIPSPIAAEAVREPTSRPRKP